MIHDDRLGCVLLHHDEADVIIEVTVVFTSIQIKMPQDDRLQSRSAGHVCFCVPSYIFQGISDSDTSNEQIKAEAARMLAKMDDLSSGYKVLLHSSG